MRLDLSLDRGQGVVGLATTPSSLFATPAIIFASFLSHSPSFAPRSRAWAAAQRAGPPLPRKARGRLVRHAQTTFGFGAFVSTSAFEEGTRGAERLL